MYSKSLIILSVLGLCACGGGGSSSSSTPPPPPPQYPIDSAISAFQQMNESFNLSASNGGNNYTLTLSWVPGAQSSFDGVSSFTSTRTVTISENGILVASDVQTGYFTISPFKPLGAVDTNGQVTVDANQVVLPDLATVGQSGAVDTYTIYTDNTRTTVYGNGTDTWALNADTSTTAFFCANTVGTTNGSPFTESDCYQTDENGNILSVTATLTENGITLNFK